MDRTWSFTAELWEWTSKTSWFFISLPESDADDIEEQFGRTAAGFGSIRVEVMIGATKWRTSIFPSKQEATYVLPVKKAVRVKEGINSGSVVDVVLAVVSD